MDLEPVSAGEQVLRVGGHRKEAKAGLVQGSK